MSDGVTYQSGMGEPPFAATGDELAVDMRWVSKSIETQKAGEELVALIEGAGQLTCNGEVYSLVKGQGVLIPNGAERSWTFETPAQIGRAHV